MLIEKREQFNQSMTSGNGSFNNAYATSGAGAPNLKNMKLQIR